MITLKGILSKWIETHFDGVEEHLSRIPEEYFYSDRFPEIEAYEIDSNPSKILLGFINSNRGLLSRHLPLHFGITVDACASYVTPPGGSSNYSEIEKREALELLASKEKILNEIRKQKAEIFAVLQSISDEELSRETTAPPNWHFHACLADAFLALSHRAAHTKGQLFALFPFAE